MSDKGSLEGRHKELLERLVSEANKPRAYSCTYRVVAEPKEWTTPEPLLDIIGVESESLSAECRETIEAHEALNQDGSYPDWMDLKWKLTALYEIQDVFDAPLYWSEESPLNVFHLWYFYFESRNLLTESILCGFNGLYAASNAVLRLFLEFSVFQLYYYTVSKEGESFARLEKYFKDRRHPSWHTAVQKAIPNSSFGRPIKARLDFHFKALSQSAAHSYHPTFSPSYHAQTPGRPSFEGIYFWQLTRFILQAVLWGYFSKFPLLFHPRNTLRKFGFSPPVGIFVDERCAAVVRRSLGEKDYALFEAQAAGDESIKPTLEWFDARPDLTDAQIGDTWNTAQDGELKRIFPEGYAKQVAKMRALRAMMAMSPVWMRPDEEADDADVPDILSYALWSKLYKRVRVRE